MADLHASKKIGKQVIDFLHVTYREKEELNLTIRDYVDIFDIAEDIYSRANGTCSEKLFIVINSLKYGFDADENDIWKVLEMVVCWNPWIEELKKIYRDEFIRQDSIYLDTKYEKMNKRMRRK